MYSIVDALLQESIEKLDGRVMDIVERMLIDVFETWDIYHNKAFVEGALCSALNSLLMSILEEEYRIKELLNSVIVQVTTSQVMVSQISKAVVTDPAVLAPIVQLLVEGVKLEAAMSIKESSVMATPLPPASGSDSSTV